MRVQASLRSFGTDLRTLTNGYITYNVYHYWRPQMQTPFIVWAETGEADDLHADNRKGEILLSITVDVYTQSEFDGLLDAVFDFFNDKEIPFELNSVDFEEDTGTIHYRFTCEMAVKENG